MLTGPSEICFNGQCSPVYSGTPLGGPSGLLKSAAKCASKKGGELVKQFKNQGTGKGARSGQHGTPFKKAGKRREKGVGLDLINPKSSPTLFSSSCI